MNMDVNIRRERGWLVMELRRQWVAEYCDGAHIYSVTEKTRERAVKKLRKELDDMGVRYD